MKIGILTGGGDVPGLNPCIKALVERAVDADHTVVGLRRGWASLLTYHPEEAMDSENNRHCAIPLDKLVVRRIDRTGGTFLHTSRTNPSNVRAEDVPEFLRDSDWSADQGSGDYTTHALKAIEAIGLDTIIAIGGDDTLSYAERLHREGIQIMCIPKTMDNDVFGTDYCIGFSTAVTRSVDFINNLRTRACKNDLPIVCSINGLITYSNPVVENDANMALGMDLFNIVRTVFSLGLL